MLNYLIDSIVKFLDATFEWLNTGIDYSNFSKKYHTIFNSKLMSDQYPSIGNYYLIKTIGVGSSAKVKLGEHKVTKAKVAIKSMKKSKIEKNPSFLKKMQREVSLMKIFDHPHLLKLFDVLETDTHLYLVLEYAKNGELFDYISQGEISVHDALKFFRQIIYGLDFLHSHSLCHRDMKLENILLDEFDNVKIADFGFARWMKDNIADTQCGSPHYAAPEVSRGGQYDGRAADIWSCGVIFYTLLCKKLPFVDASVHNLLVKIRTADYKIPDFPDPIKDLVRRMLTVDVSQRITLEQIKAHPGFRILMPEEYVMPTPFPAANVPDPIDPDSLNPEIIQVLNHIGFEDEELNEQLTANHTTQAKQFLFLILKKISFSTISWDYKTLPVVKLNINPNEEFASKDDITNGVQYQAGLPYTKILTIKEVEMKKVNAMTEIQKWLTSHDFQWVYPNDLLIIARKKDDSFEIFFEVTYLLDQKINICFYLSKGDEKELNEIFNEISEKIK